MQKSKIRKLIKSRKSQLAEAERIEKSGKAFSLLETIPDFANATNILAYFSLPDELYTEPFLHRWHERKHIFLPRVNGDDIDILHYHPDHMRQGAFGIYEPAGDILADISQMEVVIVPGVAFDRRGNRVGRGRGYYDRLLSGCHAIKIGICHDFQILEGIPADSHDVTMDYVVTNDEIIDLRNRQNDCPHAISDT